MNIPFLKNKNKDFYKYTRYLVPDKYKNNIGDYTYGHPKILEWGEGATVKIGKYCAIGRNVTIFLGGEHRVDWVTTYPFSGDRFKSVWPEVKNVNDHVKTKGDVVIGNDVWIGYNVTILSGVTIGDGAVIGTGSLVTKDVGPYEIVAGNPAILIKKRFSDKIIAQLEKIQWWNWSEEKIRKNLPKLLSSDIDDFLDESKSHS